MANPDHQNIPNASGKNPLDPKRPCDTMRGPPGEGFREVPGHIFFFNRPLTQKCSAILCADPLGQVLVRFRAGQNF